MHRRLSPRASWLNVFLNAANGGKPAMESPSNMTIMVVWGKSVLERQLPYWLWKGLPAFQWSAPGAVFYLVLLPIKPGPLKKTNKKNAQLYICPPSLHYTALPNQILQ